MHTVLALHRNGEKPTITSHDEFEKSKMEQAYQKYKSKRNEKPWLKTIPQSVPASPAYRDLCRYAGVPLKEPQDFEEVEIEEVELIEFPTIERDKSKVWTYNGQEFTTNQLAKKTGVDRKVINQRLSYGWTIRQILKHEGVI